MIKVSTNDPAGLLAAVKKAIDDRKVVTWEYDKAGDFTHTPAQWHAKAWLRPSMAEGALLFGIVKRNDESLTDEYYAVYHGRFIEMLAAHFDELFTVACATAKLQSPDVAKSKG